MSKEMNLDGIDQDVLEAALQILIKEQGVEEHLGEALVLATCVCLLCGYEEEKGFYAEEILKMGSAGEVKWIQLVDQETKKPVYNGVYSYTTHRTTCHKCSSRLMSMRKAELVDLAIMLSRASMWAARRAGKACVTREEVITHEKMEHTHRTGEPQIDPCG